jgi:hypothetical protein
MAERDALLDTLRTLLHDVMRARFEGTAYAKLARAHGYADGFMRALLDANIVGKDELLSLVSDERKRFLDADDAKREESRREAERSAA